MKQRALTGFFIGIVYVGVVLGSVYFNTLIFDVFVLFLMFTAGMEVCNCLENKLDKTVKLLILITPIIDYLVYFLINYYFSLKDALICVMAVSILLAVLAIVFTMFSKKYGVSGGAGTALTIFYPITLLFFFMSLGHLEEKLVAGAIIIAFLGTSFADMMAYFVGSLLKGPKFCPEISPKKTVSGAIGGLVGGILAGGIVCLLGRFGLLNITPLVASVWLDLLNWIAIGLGTAVFCECGDLLASYMKRVCGIKDFSNLLAGHGGIMDRIDGLTISSIFIFAYLTVYSIII